MLLRWWLGLALWLHGVGFLAIASGALGDESELGGRFTVPALVLGVAMMVAAAALTTGYKALRSRVPFAESGAVRERWARAASSARDGLVVFAVLAAVQFPIRAVLNRWGVTPMLDLGNLVIAAPAVAIGEAAHAPKVLSGIICLLGFVLGYGVAGGILGASLSPLTRQPWGRPVVICALVLIFVGIQAVLLAWVPFEVLWA